MMTPSISKGAPFSAFHSHPGYRRMFAPECLTIGIFLPLHFYSGEMSVLVGQTELVERIDRHDFAAVWVRDVPLFDPLFGDAGQVFDPFTYLSYLAARTKKVALATGSAIFSLRHPIDLAKASATIDQLSGGRLVLGIASGDRPIEFPAYGLEHERRGERFAETVVYFRQLMRAGRLSIDSPLGRFNEAELLPKPATGSIPLIVTGASRQTLGWVADYADGWLTYPEATHIPEGPKRLEEKIKAWRNLIPDGGFKPHMTNEWLDLVEDPNHPRVPQQGGYVLRTGRNGLIALLEEWQAAGVNHAALGIQFSQRPAAEVIQEVAEDVLPFFPSHQSPPPIALGW
ncbi:LLM class oxidoreductase [Pseudomonas sp. MSSRFD41]|uniref:LLM class oxidoreductase n=1 Tax=Pseudomonas sp. MSSRFD41 TaxID=1310370 RepID=UPI00163A7B68|nr:LLM class oxidoreductase [Pseudomonas sp. MSSRFD41]MBC2659067.1 LLM class oxidoreductase [Pseudomonas sp. MSSRFD41]